MYNRLKIAYIQLVFQKKKGHSLGNIVLMYYHAMPKNIETISRSSQKPADKKIAGQIRS